MAVFNIDKSITIEFHAEDHIERKILGIWADERFKDANIRIKLINENVVITVRGVQVTIIPYQVFEKLATVEVADIIVKETKERFK